MKSIATCFLLLLTLCQIPCRGQTSERSSPAPYALRNLHPDRCGGSYLPAGKLSGPDFPVCDALGGRFCPGRLRTTDASCPTLSNGHPSDPKSPPPVARQTAGAETRHGVYWIALLGTLLGCGGLGWYAIGRISYYRRCRYLAEGRLRLFRRLLELAYLYRSNPVLFQHKFLEEVSIERLECCDILCGNRELKQLQEVDSNPALKNRDILLCILLEKGFTPQELSIVYGMNNYNSIYVRLSRIRRRRTAPIPSKTASRCAPAIGAVNSSPAAAP